MRDKDQTDLTGGPPGHNHADSTGEVPRAVPHSIDEQELRMERLRAALQEGELSGDPMPFDMEQFIAEKKQAR